MLAVLGQLQRLWYLILSCSIACLISDITLSSISDPSISAFIFIPLPLVADVPTVLIFAYGIWGKSQPFLLPSSTLNPCIRWTRLLGTVLLCLLWIINTFIYSSSEMLIRRIFAGIAALNSILILVEMLGSHRIGKEQRRILKKEKRDQQEKLELKQLRLQKRREELHQGDSGFESQAIESRESMGGQSAFDRQNSGSHSDHDEDEDDEGRLREVEIIRPEAIDPSTVIFTQQMMYERQQREYFLQYQQYLQSQHHLSEQEQQNASAGPSGSVLPVAGSMGGEDGKYDDIFLESSYKFEIPIDGPLVSQSTGGIATEKTEPASIAPSTPPTTTDVKNPYIYLPSAPSLIGLNMPMPTAASHNLSSPFPHTASSASSLSRHSTLSSSSSTSVVHSDENLSAVQKQALASSSPYSEQDYQSKSQEFASAPPYESRQSLQVPVPPLIPAPALTLISTTAGSVVTGTVFDAQTTADSDQIQGNDRQPVRKIHGAKRSSI
ncbi:hypothetical protein EMPS_10962 [Entomortierella parvispora]|uniref:Uncharacterized protein n=1 Tax=Entomortierella parvispora TaxID=205924 RepID=A0A9P3HLL9_9FUNG|nr:hypothetical protein EMPS_10962 [Entomortierella parvispora]